MSSHVVTRFAPSPTGFMHIGGVRTALFAYLLAKKNNGTFILRIEDTDKEREVPGSIEHIQESLRWLGLDWDFGPDKPGAFGSLIQSERLDSYREAAQKLIDKGLAYPDPYSEEEVEKFRVEAKEAGKPFLYREHRPDAVEDWDGKKPLRFKVPEVKRYHWTDAVRGELEAGEEALDDFILIKADGYPTYNFAHIVDDSSMGITHIVRGDEFISSTPRFLSLYDALEITPPEFVTLSPILREDKTKKLGKRDGAKDILEYREEGYLPDAFVNFLAFIGWNPGTEQEIFSREELLQTFDISGIQTHGGVANDEKLKWFNREYLLKLSPDDFAAYTLPELQKAVTTRGLSYNEEIAQKILPILRERISVASEIEEAVNEGEYDFFFQSPELDPSLIAGKSTDSAGAKKNLEHIKNLLSGLEEHATGEEIKNTIWDYAEKMGKGAVLWPLRYSLSGRERSPDPFTIASILGIKESLLRIDTALEKIE